MKHISEVFRELGIPQRLVPTMYRDEQQTPFREVHLISAADYAAGSRKAHCGTVVPDPPAGPVPTCVVCIGLSKTPGRWTQ